MNIFTTIAERKIKEALLDGLFENLQGMGKPLTLEDQTGVPEDLRMACRILKNSGCIPPELELKKEILNLKDLIMTLDDETARFRKLRELNYKIMTFNMMRNAPLHINSSPDYENRAFARMIPE